MPRFSVRFFYKIGLLNSWWFLLSFYCRQPGYLASYRVPLTWCASPPFFILTDLLSKGKESRFVTFLGTECWLIHLEYSGEHRSVQEFYVPSPSLCPSCVAFPVFLTLKRLIIPEPLWLFCLPCAERTLLHTSLFSCGHEQEWLIVFSMGSIAVGKWEMCRSMPALSPGRARRDCISRYNFAGLHSYGSIS